MAAPSISTVQIRQSRREIRRPNLGVYLDRSPLDMDPRALQDCLNARIRDKRILAEGMGWENFPRLAPDEDRINLDGLQVLMIDTYVSRQGTKTTVFANKRDLFKFNPLAGPPATVSYLTPIYATGTVESGTPNTQILGTGTAWDTNIVTGPVTGGYGKNAKSGYFIAFGSNSVTDPAATWYEIDAVASDTELSLLVDPGVIAPSTAYTIRQILQGDELDLFDSDIFQNAQDSSPPGLDVYYLTNGVEMLSWDGSANQMAWFYPGFIARGLFSWRQAMIAYNLTEGGNEKPGAIRYSELTMPRNFATNGAAEITPTDGVYGLQAVMPLGNQIVIYYEGNVVLLQFIDAPLYFAFHTAVAGKGLVAPRALMDFGDYHEFLSKDTAYQFDGVSIREAGSQVFRSVMRASAPDRLRRAYCSIDEENGEVIWVIPLTTDGQDLSSPPVTAYTSHYLEDVGPNLMRPMMIRDFPFTAVGYYESQESLRFSDFPEEPSGVFDGSSLRFNARELQAAFPLLIAGDANGDIYILNTSNAKNMEAIESYVVFPRVSVGDGVFKGLVQRVEPYASRREGASDLLEVRVRTYEFAEGDPSFESAHAFDLSHQGLRYVPMRRAGRYADVRFGTNASGAPWDCSGYAVLVSPMGERQ